MSLSGRMLRHDGAVGAVGAEVPGGKFMGAALAEWETEWGGISKGGSGWRGGMEIWSGEIDRCCMWLPSIPPHKVLPVRTSEPQVETQVWGVWGEREWGAVQLVRWDRWLEFLTSLSLLRKQRGDGREAWGSVCLRRNRDVTVRVNKSLVKMVKCAHDPKLMCLDL